MLIRKPQIIRLDLVRYIFGLMGRLSLCELASDVGSQCGLLVSVLLPTTYLQFPARLNGRAVD